MEVDTPIETVKPIDVVAEVKQLVSLLEKGVTLVESRFINRALRGVASVRSSLNVENLDKITQQYLGNGTFFSAAELSKYYTQDAKMSEDTTTKPHPVEVDSFVIYLVVLFLHDQKQYAKGAELSSVVIKKILDANRRSLDQIAAKIYFYFARFHEVSGNFAAIRSQLFDFQRQATLHKDHESLAVLLNLLVRNYLHYNLYDQADKLLSKSSFPENAPNNQLARYMYYLGKIKAIQLDYTSAYQYLQQAIRKAPQSDHAAGFHQAVYKYFVIVQLLMGEIPDRSTFRIPMLQKPLAPYFHITRAVRTGDLTEFQDVLAKYGSVFKADKTFTLILRLRHSVIKAGIRMISLAYSRISLRDICLKLKLDSEEDAEYIVAKAIRDGVIDATLNREEGYMKSKENVDVYSTSEPQAALHQRISFCLKIHNESVKAMRYPGDEHKKELALANALLEEDRKLISEIEEKGGFDDEDDDMGEL